MSTGHSISGATAGYGACLFFELCTTINLAWGIPHIVAVIVAGWANWPDCDTRKSTVTTSLGALTIALHHLVVTLCAVIYYATRSEADDPKRPVIHRGATHTWPGAAFMGALVAVICAVWPHWGTPIVLGVSLHWAARGLYMPTNPDRQLSASRLKGKSAPRRLGIVIYHNIGLALKHVAVKAMRSKWVPLPGKYLRASGRSGTAAVCMGLAFYLTQSTGGALDTHWTGLLGAAATLGCLTHMLGDSVTECGICWLFPFKHPRTGKRWEFVHLPKWLAFKTGKAFEIGVMYPLLIAGAFVAAPGGYPLVARMVTAWRDGGAMAMALPFGAWPMTTEIPATTLPQRCATVARAPRSRPAPKRCSAGATRPPNQRPCPRPPARPRSHANLRSQRTRRPRRTP
jgi:membrane-bound metal-dependent hydrolase YbcI (DUF457 family)